MIPPSYNMSEFMQPSNLNFSKPCICASFQSQNVAQNQKTCFSEPYLRITYLAENFPTELYIKVAKMFEGDEMVDAATAKSSFDLAAKLGKITKSEAACRKRFKGCRNARYSG